MLDDRGIRIRFPEEAGQRVTCWTIEESGFDSRKRQDISPDSQNVQADPSSCRVLMLVYDAPGPAIEVRSF
jgi:hypothetical protein